MPGSFKTRFLYEKEKDKMKKKRKAKELEESFMGENPGVRNA